MNNYDDIPDFYKVYCERDLVSLSTAVMLWLDINPDEFDDQEEYHQYLKKRELYEEATEITIKIQHAALHTKELETIFTALAFSSKIEQVINTNHSFDTNGIPIVHSVNLLKFVLWTEKKNYQHPFPKKLANMVKFFHNVPDFKQENEELKEKISDVVAQNSKLQKKLETPIDRRTEKGYIEMIAIMAKTRWADSTDKNFNANYISNQAAMYKFNFRIMTDETMRKYIAPARKCLGLPPVVNNKSIPKN